MSFRGQELSVPAKSFEENLAYSPAGMVTRVMESGSVVGDAVKEYVYDYAGRLVEEMVDGESKEFSFDARGNILSDGDKAYLYEGDILKQCVLEGGTDSLAFSYDQMGRMRVDGLAGVEMEYNSLNLISKVSRGDTICVKYSYLADGKKLSSLKEDGSGLEYRGPFVYRRDGSGDLTFESAAYDGGRLTEDKSYCYLTDHLGSTRAVGGISRYSLEEVVDYSAFGEKSQVSGSSLFRDYFTGKEDQMPHFALPYTDFGARMYSPELHRWLSPDPLSEKYYGSSHYSYCANNPVIFVDPDGRIYETAWDVLSIIVDMGFAVYYQLSGNTEAANEALFDAGSDFIAALIPGYIAGLSKIRYLADVPAISKIKLPYLDDVLSPEDFSKISHMERGRLNEKRVLEAAGLQKNTKKYPGQTKKHGVKDVIPDSVTDNAFFEIKDVKKLNNSPQIEAELDAAIKEGKEYYIITGKNTKIAPNIESNSKIKIIRMEGIGPK